MWPDPLQYLGCLGLKEAWVQTVGILYIISRIFKHHKKKKLIMWLLYYGWLISMVENMWKIEKWENIKIFEKKAKRFPKLGGSDHYTLNILLWLICSMNFRHMPNKGICYSAFKKTNIIYMVPKDWIWNFKCLCVSHMSIPLEY